MAKICSSFDQQCADLRPGGPARIEEPGRPGHGYSILKQSNKLLKVHSSCSFKFPFAKCSSPHRTLADFACKRRASDAPCGSETLIHSPTEIVLLLLRARSLDELSRALQCGAAHNILLYLTSKQNPSAIRPPETGRSLWLWGEESCCKISQVKSCVL